MNPIFLSLRGFGPLRLAAMLGVAVASIAFFTYVSTRLTSPSMSLLFSELAIDDSGQIITRLEGMNIPFELRGDGTQILCRPATCCVCA